MCRLCRGTGDSRNIVRILKKGRAPEYGNIWCSVLLEMGIYFAGRFMPFYGTCIAVGISVAAIAAYFLSRHRGLVFDSVLLLSAYGMFGGLLGAKTLYMLVEKERIQWGRILEWDYWNVLMQGGYVFYGGLIGGFLALFLAGRLHKIKLWSYIEACIPCIPLAHAFGRIGCHLAGCCYGIEYNGVGHIVYHAPSFAPTEVSLFPVQLAEAVFNFMIATFLFVWI